jgi:hypothetical protein
MFLSEIPGGPSAPCGLSFSIVVSRKIERGGKFYTYFNQTAYNFSQHSSQQLFYTS